ncbi:uncharacterized protein LOC110466457 isoform X2 [Mizuhopecten yessoensis]|nr:uncharacterized protein LOC110466457 isoform X2 [Mizuhopecten yessoensis]
MTKVAKSKKGGRKLYTFSTPYSQSTINQSTETSDPPQLTQTLENDKGYFIDMCDILGGTTTTHGNLIPEERVTSWTKKHSRCPKETANYGGTCIQMKSEKRRMTTSTIVVDGLGIAVHQKLVSASVTHSSNQSRRTADKKMMNLNVLGTIFKMKHELDIIRERRLVLAKKQRNTSTTQEE